MRQNLFCGTAHPENQITASQHAEESEAAAGEEGKLNQHRTSVRDPPLSFSRVAPEHLAGVIDVI